MRGAVLRALWSHWRRQPLQLATLLAGLALATALWTGVQAINAEARASYAEAAAAFGAGGEVIRGGEAGIPLASFVRLRRAGWPVAPVLRGSLQTPAGGVEILGIDMTNPPPAARLSGADPAEPAGTDGTDDPYAALIAPGTGFAAASTIAALRAAGRPDLPRLLDDASLAPGQLLTDLAVAERLLGRQGMLSELILTAPPPPEAAPLAELAPALRRQREAGAGGDLARLTASFHLNLSAFGFLAFAVGLFIVHGAIGLAFEQRRPMLRTLRALGVPLGELVAILLAELVVLSFLAGAAGVGLGYLLARALLPDVAATLEGLYGAALDGELALRASWWATGLTLAILGTLAASAQGLWRIARMPVLAAGRPRAWLRASRRGLAAQGAAGAVLLLAGVAAGWWGEGLFWGFAFLGGLLLGAALMLPLLLAALLSLGRHAASTPRWQWFWADTQQQLPGLSLALMALMLALAANVGVGTMVSSFRLTFTGWLDQRLAAELYVTARDRTEAQAIADWSALRTDAVLPIWHANARINGAPAEVYGIADDPTYRDNWPILAMGPGGWARLAAGEAVFINEQLARRDALRPGDSIDAGPLGSMPVGGIYSDYGNPRAQIMVTLSQLDRAFPDAERNQLALRLAPERAAALAGDLRAAFDLPPGAILRQQEIKARSLAIFERTFAVTAALNLLTLLVAGFAILTSLLTLSAMRLPQLAPVWALGETRRRLALIEGMRSLVLAMLTFALALPVGLVLAWALLAVVNVQAFGWRLPMFLFPADWLRLFLLSLGVALAGAALPLRRLARRQPADFLRVFASER